jgi:hypothetical protein
MTRLTLLTILVASFGAACTDDTGPTEPGEGLPPDGTTSGTQDETWDHENDGASIWDQIDRLTKEGPFRYTSRVHSCAKVRYRTFGTLLSTFGVNVASTTALSPGELYRDGYNAMGGPNFANRIRENITLSTSGASRAFDIFAAAAPEIITAIPTLARCAHGGQNAVLFNPDDTCNPTGVTCLLGAPATLAHLGFCNLSITSASTPTIGKRIAVAALLAAAYTCE